MNIEYNRGQGFDLRYNSNGFEESRQDAGNAYGELIGGLFASLPAWSAD